MILKMDPELEKCLPPLDEETYQGIKESLSINGYDNAFPIIVWGGHDVVVDGHHRYKACVELGIEPKFVEHSFESLDDAILYALEHQDNRRNQTVTQKALNGVKRRLIQERIAARNRQLIGKNQHAQDLSVELRQGRACEHVAKMVGVSPRTIEQVSAVINKGVPELEDMMRNNSLAADTANKFVQTTPIEKQAQYVQRGPDAIKKHVHDVRQEERNAAKARLLQEEQEKERSEIKEYKEVLTEQFGGSKLSCGLSSVFEMWCNSCKCAFDIFKPSVAKFCPVCSGVDIGKREESWYPGKRAN